MRRRLQARGLWPCCRRSLACVLDTYAHALHINWRRVCDRHDAAIMAEVLTGVDWLEALNGRRLLHHFDTLPKAEAVGSPRAVVTSTWPIITEPQTWGAGSTVTLRWTDSGFVPVAQTSGNWRAR